MAVGFKVGGNMRFLSHAETVNVFQRACVRAGIKMQYSQGFNPRPRLSLPLPRSVGVESDDELLCLRVAASDFDAEAFKRSLSAQLPEGCELLRVDVTKGKTAFSARLATYVLTVRGEYSNEKLKTNIRDLLARESLAIERRINAKGSVRTVDVRGFLKSVEFDDSSGIVTVECEISPAGTIRVDEILKLLELDVKDLAAPIRRAKVQWESN